MIKIKLTEPQVKMLAGLLAGFIEGSNDVSHETAHDILFQLTGIFPVIENEWEKIGWPKRSMREMVAQAGEGFVTSTLNKLETTAREKIPTIFPGRKNDA